MAKFTHLHVHSEYSLLDGLTKYGPLMERVKELGMDSIALTDHGGMYGAIKFYVKAKAAGIKPIIGVETYIAKRTRFDKDPKLDSEQYHLILLAKSTKGYQNLMKIVSKSYLEGYYYKPRVDMDLLQEYHDGIIALSGCLSGIGQAHWKKGEDEMAEEGMLKLFNIFGKDFYAEIQRHPSLKELAIVNPKLIAFARKHGIPLVATADSHYLNKEDAEAQELLLCIQTQKTITDPNRGLSMIGEPNFYIKSPEEMETLFLDLPEAIENTQRIADQIDIEIPMGKLIYPNYPLPKGKTADVLLKEIAYERLPNRFSEITKEVTNRLDYELSIINQKGYPTYFLIVQDFVNWAKDNGVGVGPGRGSAAGSLVAYTLGITDLDPFVHKLPFERFLNPERASPPDVDMDFADDRREDVIKYVTQKYGEDHVAQIITFGTMESRAAVRDAGRALGYSYSDCDRIAKMVPQGAQGSHMTIDHALELSPELAQAYQNEDQTKRLLDVARKLSGVARHASVHAAGVIISDKPLVEYTPVQRESKGDKIITQYDMYSLDLNVSDDAVGLMKMDFLGLRNLSILQRTLNFIKEQSGETVVLSTLPFDDPAVFKIITSGETTGIFQIESAGMRRLARDLRPSNFGDISAMIALFRPGPMDLIPSFTEGKRNRASVKYPHPDLKPILEETYGVIVYQEQCMEIAVKFAGYTMGTADLLRRAIGKKKKELMAIEKKKFVEGAQKLGHTQKEADDIFALIEKFASYGFNKAHSASYALITYQTAYMKAHYPIEFMAAVLSAETAAKSGGAKDEKVADVVSECKKMGIVILPPSINHSQAEFVIEQNADGGRGIRFSFGAIKNIGGAVIESITAERDAHEPFVDFLDFLKRVETDKVNKRTIESLINCGAFDQFGKRKDLLFVLEQALDQINRIKKGKLKNQDSLFGDDTDEFHIVIHVPENIADYTQLEAMQLEKELLGYYYSSENLFAEFAEAVAVTTHKIGQLTGDGLEGTQVVVLGLVTQLKKIMTKASNAEMAFVKIEDESGEFECTIFPKTYTSVKELLESKQPVLISGKIDLRNDQKSLLVDTIVPPSMAYIIKERAKMLQDQPVPKWKQEREAAQKKATTRQSGGLELFIKKGTTREQLEQVNLTLKQYPGTTKVTVVLENKNALQRIVYPTPIDVTPALEQAVRDILGGDCFQASIVN